MKKDGERKRKVYISLSVTEYWCWNVPACWWEGLHLWTCCRCPLISERCLFGVVIFRGFCSMCFLITLSHLIGLFFSIFRHLRCAFVDVRSRDARDLISVAKLFFSSPPSPIVALCCPLSFFSFFSHAATVPVLHKLSNLPSSSAHYISLSSFPNPSAWSRISSLSEVVVGGRQLVSGHYDVYKILWMDVCFQQKIATWFTGTVVRTKLLCVFCFYPHTHSFSEVLFHN